LFIFISLFYGADCGLLEYAEKEGVITSPLYPEQYPSNLNCTYVVTSSPRSSITIIFDVLDIELAENCKYDNISVSSRALLPMKQSSSGYYISWSIDS